MFRQLNLEDAARESWDVVLAGSSFSAMFFLLGLPRGLRVLILEKGTVQEHADQITQGTQGLEAFEGNNTSGTVKHWTAHSVFGGNSNCWWACVPRMMPADFRLRSTYGVGQDWPIDYDTLEPYYARVEEVMEVAGGGSDHLLPRSTPFPYPPLAPSRSDVALQAHSPNWFAQPAARSNGGRRSACCANGMCNLCPVDAKFSVLNSIDLFNRDGVALVTGAEVRAVDIAGGTARGVEVRGGDGRLATVAADVIALGTNAVFNAAILMRSGVQAPALGRYLSEQVGQVVILDTGPGQRNYFGGTSITGHGYDLYDGPHRADRGAVLIENHNAPASLRAEPGRWTERLRLKLIAEAIPQADNRVRLQDDSVVLDWTGHGDYALRGLEAAVEALPDLLPFDVEAMMPGPLLPSEDHIQGAHRMGVDPATSVVDDRMRCHGVSNLFALGAGAFPTASPANPTLTISALSLRAAEAI